jgi:AcrR family transcriptional regulator
LVTQDRRIRRTQQLLARALISLTLENGYEAVTIRDITTRADVGYATFFRHYKDKNELLQDVVEVVLEELVDLFLLEASTSEKEEVGLVLFQYVQKNTEVVRLLFSTSDVLERLIVLATGSFVDMHKDLPESPIIPLEIAANHVVSASIALVRWWLANNMPHSPEQMGQIYYELIVRPTQSPKVVQRKKGEEN